MRRLALVAIVVLTGCAAAKTPPAGTDPKITSLEEERQIVAGREQQCIDNTLTRSRGQMARVVATADASVESMMQLAEKERDRRLAECRARADGENAEISARERNEYELQRQQEHDRTTLMMMLTTSRLR
jgi:hypothetical protein